jgi:hypothetical protein
MHTPLNQVVLSIFGLAALFCAGRLVIDLPHFIILLNGIYAGTLAAIVVAYWKILSHSVLGTSPYNRVRQMTLGFFAGHMAFALTVAVSVWLRSAALDVNNTTMTALARYVAIIAGVLQVTAPDFGLGIFHGRERRTLYASMIVGLTVAVGVTMAQENEILDGFNLGS